MKREPRHGNTRVVAIDGGSGAGKTALAQRLAMVLDVDVVHADDLAWHHSFFDWWTVLVEAVLEPLAQERPVRFRPPAWQQRERPGAIEADPGRAVLVEGVGAGRRELADRIDYLVWVDCDRQVAMARALGRPGETVAFWREWEQYEEAHLEADRPSLRADLVLDNSRAGLEDLVAVRDRATWRWCDRPQEHGGEPASARMDSRLW